ncbi:MAG: hypothetical protein ACFNZW_00305 [Coriobacteriaceae bacterium]
MKLQEPPHTFDTVGGFLRPQRLKQARIDFAAEKLSCKELIKVEDE